MESQGKIACIGIKYVIEGDRRFIKPSPILNTLLPGDIVGYTIQPLTNKIKITRLISRVPFKTLGFVKTDQKVFYPLLPQTFTLCPDLTNLIPNKPTCVILIDSQGPCILSQWDDISLTRLSDWTIVLDLYKPIDVNIPQPILKTNSNLNTKPVYQDLTHLETFNIDPTESKDFDDAISLDVSNSKIYVHIVDAHNQIAPGSNEDIQAFTHAFTLYLPEHVNNILPDELANNQLSLIKSQLRKTITVEYTLDPKTFQIDQSLTKIYYATIIIKKRYDYESWDLNPNPWVEKFLIQYAQTFKPVCLDSPSLKLQIDNQTGRMIGYQIETSGLETSQSHKLITWLMIHTNITIGQMPNGLEKIPQRYHSKAVFAHGSNQEICLHTLTDNMHINTVLGIKKFKKAIYSSTESGHDGLKLSLYTHFTSPIRRYFDVIVHRIITGVEYSNLDQMLEYINQREVYIDSIVRLYSRLKILGYLESNTQLTYPAYWIPQGLILGDLLFEIKYYPVDQTKLYEKVQVQILGINWDKLEPEIRIC